MPDLPASSFPLDRRLTPEERGAQLEALSREVEREEFWDAARTIGACFAWCALGIAGLSWSVASTDARVAPVIFWGSIAACNAGILLTLHGAMRRAARRDGGW